jgi:shikimate dehydrogenase
MIRATRPGRLVLLGHPVAHSLSPRFQAAALARAGITLAYEALDVPPSDLSATLQTLRQVHAAGNVTIPYKAAMAALCDRLTPLSERTGAVNTFWHESEALVGDNTDAGGFNALVVSVCGEIPRNARVALIGAGGAAAAVCEAMSGWEGARISLIARRPSSAAALAARYSSIATGPCALRAALHDATLVVNATPVGMTDDATPVDAEWLPRDADVIDLVYRADETAFVRAARARAHRAADGLAMLVEQGARAFVRWFGIAPDRGAMWEALGRSPTAPA